MYPESQAGRGQSKERMAKSLQPPQLVRLQPQKAHLTPEFIISLRKGHLSQGWLRCR